MTPNELYSPLTVFVHVPKTAGSTVNAYLERSGRRGASHVEAWINDRATVPSKLKTLEWVSGHVDVARMREKLSAGTRRHLEFFTLVRDPLKQLMSHYNWLIEIYHRGASFYDGHPPRIKEISEAIRGGDNNDPKNVVAQLSAAPGLFLNQQSRLVLGGMPDSLAASEFRERLKVFDLIATERSLPDFISRISGVTYEDKRRENVSPYHFDKAVFDTPVVREFVAKRHAADLALYRYLTEG